MTVFGAVSILNILDMESKSAEGVLTTIAGSMTGQGGYNMNFNPGEPLVILSPEHAAIMAQQGMSKDDVRAALHEKASLPLSTFAAEQVTAMLNKWHRPVVDGMVHVSAKPADIQLFVAGGMGPHSVFAPTFSSKTVTREISDK
ncbi:MAG: hypothetical protein HYX92_11970 [Chloroflexi bacterium]|nr:hypothetical protein [Chloroflexota bacterium]